MLYKPRDLSKNAYVKYGVVNEDNAISAYSASTGNVGSPSGLFVHMEYPYLGASPDGLVDDDGVVEVKCLPSIGNLSFKDAIEVKKNICLAFVDNKLSLKKSHYYYYQIQGQLAIANRDFCDLVVYADKDIHIERVPRDDATWEGVMLPKLKQFYLECLLPEIANPRVPRGLEVRDPVA
jgi:YqaJ-like viral recombinase domain